MKAFPLVNSFAAGEISPYLHMRDDLPAIRHGAKKLGNLLTNSQGAAFSRRGSKLLGTIDDISAMSAFDFWIDEKSSYTLFLTYSPTNGGRIYWSDHNELVLNATQYIGNPTIEYPLVDWSIIEYPATLKSYMMYWPAYYPLNYFWLGQRSLLSTPTYLSVHRTFTVPSTGNYLLKVNAEVCATSEEGDIIVSVGTSMGTYKTNGSVIEGTLAYNATEWSSVIALSTGVTYHISLHCEKLAENPSILRYGPRVSLTEYPSYPDYIAHSLGSGIEELYAEMVPGENKAYVVGENIAPQEITYDPATGNWTIGAISFTAMPSDWGAGSYPRTVAFFQGRSWWGGVADAPETFWGSKSGVFTDLTVGANPDDAIEYTISRKGAIRWIVGANNLIIGTSVGEYSIMSEGGFLAPGDVEARPQESVGSNLAHPLNVGSKVIFVNADGTKLYDMGYSWEKDQWTAREISYVSEQLMQGDPVVRIAFARGPRRQIHAITSQRKVLTCLYDDANNVIGWHKHPTVSVPTHLSCGTVRGVSRATLAYIDTDSVLRILLWDADFCLDEYVEFSFVTASTALTGLTHFAGETVQAIADGKYVPSLSVDASGNATLSEAASAVVVGRGFTQTLTTLPGGLSTNAGSGRAPEKSWSKIFLRLYKSYIPKINGIRPRVRRSDTQAFEESGILEDGFVEVTNMGYNADGTITVEQDEPFPICITGIYGELEQETV